MKKMAPLNGRVLVTSRGTKEEAGSLVLPETVLRDSNVCKTEDGKTVICRDLMGYELGDHKKIVLEEDIIASVVSDKIIPIGKWVLCRKCLDPVDESGVIVSQTRNSNQWVEILEVSDSSRLKEYVGKLALVLKTDSDMQSVEETEADWLIKESSLAMIVDPED